MEQTFRNLRTGRLTTVSEDSPLLPGLLSNVEDGRFALVEEQGVEDAASEPQDGQEPEKAKKTSRKASKTQEGS